MGVSPGRGDDSGETGCWSKVVCAWRSPVAPENDVHEGGMDPDGYGWVRMVASDWVTMQGLMGRDGKVPGHRVVSCRGISRSRGVDYAGCH